MNKNHLIHWCALTLVFVSLIVLSKDYQIFIRDFIHTVPFLTSLSIILLVAVIEETQYPILSFPLLLFLIGYFAKHGYDDFCFYIEIVLGILAKIYTIYKGNIRQVAKNIIFLLGLWDIVELSSMFYRSTLFSGIPNRNY